MSRKKRPLQFTHSAGWRCCYAESEIQRLQLFAPQEMILDSQTQIGALLSSQVQLLSAQQVESLLSRNQQQQQSQQQPFALRPPHASLSTSPPILHSPRRAQSGRSGDATPVATQVDPPASSIEYQEWCVVKTNRRGKRQQHLLGVDLLSIHNKQASNVSPSNGAQQQQQPRLEAAASQLSSFLNTFDLSSVKKDSRPISSVISVAVDPLNARVFNLQFRDKHTLVTRLFEAQSAEQAKQCVDRIALCMRLSQQQSA